MTDKLDQLKQRIEQHKEAQEHAANNDMPRTVAFHRAEIAGLEFEISQIEANRERVS